MIASTLLAAALAAQPAPSAPPSPPMGMGHDHSAMAGKAPMAMGKMECCKDGCACCGKKDDAAKR